MPWSFKEFSTYSQRKYGYGGQSGEFLCGYWVLQRVKSRVHCTAEFSACFKSLSGLFFSSTLTQINVGPPFSTDLILANSESILSMVGSYTLLRKQWKKFSSAQSENQITCAKAEAFTDLNRSVLVCSSLLLFSQGIIVSQRIWKIIIR